jgi:hypothetical protein
MKQPQLISEIMYEIKILQEYVEFRGPNSINKSILKVNKKLITCIFIGTFFLFLDD